MNKYLQFFIFITITIMFYELVQKIIKKIIKKRKSRKVARKFTDWAIKTLEKEKFEPVKKKRTTYNKPYISKLIVRTISKYEFIINTTLFFIVKDLYFEKYKITITLSVFQEMLRKLKKLNIVNSERVGNVGNIGGSKFYYSLQKINKK